MYVSEHIEVGCVALGSDLMHVPTVTRLTVYEDLTLADKHMARKVQNELKVAYMVSGVVRQQEDA
jgi:TolB-like protein